MGLQTGFASRVNTILIREAKIDLALSAIQAGGGLPVRRVAVVSPLQARRDTGAAERLRAAAPRASQEQEGEPSTCRCFAAAESRGPERDASKRARAVSSGFPRAARRTWRRGRVAQRVHRYGPKSISGRIT